MAISGWILTFGISAFGGYVFQNLFSGEYEGHRVERSLHFQVRGYYVHIHHWIYSTLIIIILICLNEVNPIILGVLSGFIIQGLTYRDRFIVAYPKDKFHEIYDKWKPKDEHYKKPFINKLLGLKRSGA